MYHQDLIEAIKDLFLRYESVKTFKFQSKAYNNAQGNNAPFQVYCENFVMYQLNITTNVFTAELNLHILAQPTQEPDSILDIQDKAVTIAANVLAALDYWPEYRGIISLHDYSLMTVSHYTDDDSAGVRLSIVLETPSPVNLCELDDYFNEEPYEPEEEPELDIDEPAPVGDLKLKKIKLPKNNGC